MGECKELLGQVKSLMHGLNPQDDIADKVDPDVQGRSLTKYLNRNDVMHALHVAHRDKLYGNKWQVANNDLNSRFNSSVIGAELLATYRRVIAQHRMLFYVGDADFGTQRCMERCVPTLGFPEKKAWAQWHFVSDEDGRQIGGYTVEYKAPADSQLSYATVHGAGHQVPQQEGYQVPGSKF